jgi:hypothetical protein
MEDYYDNPDGRTYDVTGKIAQKLLPRKFKNFLLKEVHSIRAFIK